MKDKGREWYAAARRRPEWQRKRLEIMQRDGFKCCVCGAADKPLMVHHHGYRKGALPWEYPDDELQTLCEECHAKTGPGASAEEFLTLLIQHLGAHNVARLLWCMRRCKTPDTVHVGLIQALRDLIARFPKMRPDASEEEKQP